MLRLSVRAVLRHLCDLFTIYHIRKALATLLEDGYITGTQARLISSTLSQCCRDVRTQAIPLVDAFHYSDDLVRSPLGRYDGNVYEGETHVHVHGKHSCSTHSHHVIMFGRQPVQRDVLLCCSCSCLCSCLCSISLAFFLRVKNAPESQSRPFYWETYIKPNLYR